jgi:hypothetical protein
LEVSILQISSTFSWCGCCSHKKLTSFFAFGRQQSCLPKA